MKKIIIVDYFSWYFNNMNLYFIINIAINIYNDSKHINGDIIFKCINNIYIKIKYLWY